VFSQFCVVEPRTTAIIVKRNSGINSVADLAGKSVAVNRSGLGEFLLVAALEKFHVDRSKVRVVYLNPPEAAPAFGSGQVDAWAMWSPQVEMARNKYDGKAIFLEGRDLNFQIDFNSWLVRQSFATRNRDLVAAVSAAFAAEAAWASQHSQEAEAIAQKAGKYDDATRDEFIGLRRRYTIHSADDQAFLADLQRGADWLTARKVLPASIRITDHIATV
jgi:sulfonate transport system substrate-binding protein